MMSWEGLEEAVAIADAGTFVGAARSLRISTSQISKVVARLEARLQTSLFHRTTRAVRLTDTGRAFVDQARRIIEERDVLLSLVNGATEPQGDLRITCSTALGERFVAALVRQFALDHPRLSISLDLTNRLVDIVGEGYDLAIRTGRLNDDRLTGRLVADRRLETCAGPAYLADAGTPQEISDLENHACLIGTSSQWHFLEDGRPRHVTPLGRWRCNSGLVIAQAAQAGMGICQLPLFYVQPYLETGQLVPVLTAFRSAPEPIWAVYPRKRHLLPKIRNMVDLLEARLQPLIDAGPGDAKVRASGMPAAPADADRKDRA